MRILALGDIVGPSTVSELNKKLWSYRKENKIDFTVANGENASVGNGITTADAKTILESGVDVITSGNHVWQKTEIRSFLSRRPSGLRKTTLETNSLAHRTTWLRSDLMQKPYSSRALTL